MCEYSHSIHTEGGGEGANAAYLRRCEGTFQKKSLEYFLYSREYEYRPHMYLHKNEFLKFFPACTGFMPGGTSKKNPQIIVRVHVYRVGNVLVAHGTLLSLTAESPASPGFATTTSIWGSPRPLHLKPQHLKMVFFSACCRLGGALPV